MDITKATEVEEQDLPAELEPEDVAPIVQAWPLELQDAFARWLVRACTSAGIMDRGQRRALQAELLNLFDPKA